MEAGLAATRPIPLAPVQERHFILRSRYARSKTSGRVAEHGVQVIESTGRFQGAVGSYRGLITSFDETAATDTTTLQGGLSTVGSNK